MTKRKWMTLVMLMTALMMIFAFSACKKEVTCSFCNGKGEIPLYENAGECVQCGGTGTDPRTNDTCGTCLGKGYYQKTVGYTKCTQCDGTGKVEE